MKSYGSSQRVTPQPGPSQNRSRSANSSHSSSQNHHQTSKTTRSSVSKRSNYTADDYDHHTLSTATTASATISYSTDQGDEMSEMGMEVIMSNDGTTNPTVAINDALSGATPYRSHSFPAGKHTFTVDERYSMIRSIGSGAYGVVISAKDAAARRNVAIKMVPKAFADEIDAKRILREIKLLKHLRHENIVQLLDMMPPNVTHLEDFRDVYMATDLMETDLHRIIYSKQKLTVDHVQYFVYQVLRGVHYIHACGVLHRDLKPSNLLVNSNCDLKICDFGLARGIKKNDENENETMMLTEYVVTRWYRAPEIMLACHEYSYPIDVWSVGCIFAELILRKPLFPGEDYIDQLKIITDKLGNLKEEELDFVTSEKARRFMKKLPSHTPPPLTETFVDTPPSTIDAMHKMLNIHPAKRATIEETIEHPFFATLFNASDIRQNHSNSQPFDFSFERTGKKLHRLRLQELIWKEVGDFRPSCLPVASTRGKDP